MKTKDTEALGRWGAKPSKIKAWHSWPTCKNWTAHTFLHHYNSTQYCNIGKVFFQYSPSSRPTSHLRCGQVEVTGSPFCSAVDCQSSRDENVWLMTNRPKSFEAFDWLCYRHLIHIFFTLSCHYLWRSSEVVLSSAKCVRQKPLLFFWYWLGCHKLPSGWYDTIRQCVFNVQWKADE